jgi:hypothetical protein
MRKTWVNRRRRAARLYPRHIHARCLLARRQIGLRLQRFWRRLRRNGRRQRRVRLRGRRRGLWCDRLLCGRLRLRRTLLGWRGKRLAWNADRQTGRLGSHFRRGAIGRRSRLRCRRHPWRWIRLWGRRCGLRCPNQGFAGNPNRRIIRLWLVRLGVFRHQSSQFSNEIVRGVGWSGHRFRFRCRHLPAPLNCSKPPSAGGLPRVFTLIRPNYESSSGAATPRIPRPLRITWRTASTSASRAKVSFGSAGLTNRKPTSSLPFAQKPWNAAARSCT